MIGKKISHFEIREKIGQGGMGIVYGALDLNLNRFVAIKVLSPEAMQNPTRKGRFVLEAKAASSLNHPNILTIYEIGSEDGIDFIVMEKVPGVPLAEILTKAAVPAVSDALQIAVQVAEALSKAHQSGIIHRDIKPQNIMITDNQAVKILDFGLAKLLEIPQDENPSENTTMSVYTEPGSIVGTPHYMSPEQAEGKKLDERSDVFSFGCVMYELLSGRRPFSGNSRTEVLSSILRDSPPPLQKQRKDLPEELVRIVNKMLEKDVRYRYQHMQEVLSDFLKLKRDMDSGAGRPVMQASRSIVWAAACVIAAGLIAAGVYVWIQKQKVILPAPQAQIHLISDSSGSHSMASFSPDGSMIAFVSNAGGIPQIWIENLAGGEPRPVTFDNHPASRPRWSPKNDQIVFCRGSFEVSRETESIWSLPPLGGKPHKLIDMGRNPNWSRDGNLLVFERKDEIWTADTNGLDQKKLEGVPDVPLLLADRNPAFSPDGSQIAFFQSDKGPFGDYWVIPSAGGKARRLTFDMSEGSAPAWMPDGKHILIRQKRKHDPLEDLSGRRNSRTDDERNRK